MLALEGIWQVEALAGMVRIEQEHTDVGTTFCIGQTHRLASPEDEGKMAPARNSLLMP
jgi:hypothetical protein